jgi:hypothetical protein
MGTSSKTFPLVQRGKSIGSAIGFTDKNNDSINKYRVPDLSKFKKQFHHSQIDRQLAQT